MSFSKENMTIKADYIGKSKKPYLIETDIGIPVAIWIKNSKLESECVDQKGDRQFYSTYSKVNIFSRGVFVFFDKSNSILFKLQSKLFFRYRIIISGKEPINVKLSKNINIPELGIKLNLDRKGFFLNTQESEVNELLGVSLSYILWLLFFRWDEMD